MSSKPAVLTATCRPLVPLPVPWAAQPVRFKPELSELAGSPGLPAAKVDVTPPTSEIVPDPVLGVVMPVEVLASAGLELKFQPVMVDCACAASREAKVMAGIISFFMVF